MKALHVTPDHNLPLLSSSPWERGNLFHVEPSEPVAGPVPVDEVTREDKDSDDDER